MRPAAGILVALHVARRGQRPLVGLSLPLRRHRGEHPLQVGHHLGADDLPRARLREPRTAGSSRPAVALAGLAGGAQRRGLGAPGRPSAPSRHQDTHPARRSAPRRSRHLHRRRTSPPRHGRLPLPPRRQHRPQPHGRAHGSTRERSPAPSSPARVASAVHRLGRRCPQVAGHIARGDAPSLRRLVPPPRPQCRPGALRRPPGRPRRFHAPARRAARPSASTRSAGLHSSGPPRSSRCAPMRRAPDADLARPEGSGGVLPPRKIG